MLFPTVYEAVECFMIDIANTDKDIEFFKNPENNQLLRIVEHNGQLYDEYDNFSKPLFGDMPDKPHTMDQIC